MKEFKAKWRKNEKSSKVSKHYIFMDSQTESYCEEENNLVFEKLGGLFIHIYWKSPCCL